MCWLGVSEFGKNGQWKPLIKQNHRLSINLREFYFLTVFVDKNYFSKETETTGVLISFLLIEN